jgi:ubiquinone/menaquinone biosynthesis C-methylase UbiE
VPLSTKSGDAVRIEEHLREQARIYDVLSPRYHLERFSNPFGRYEFQESRALIQDLVRGILPQLPRSWRALDVASGTGKAAISVASLGGKVLALDAAEGMLKECRKFAKADGVCERMEFVNGSAITLPFADNSFDLVLSFRFLHLLTIRIYPALLKEMSRVTKPGGYVLIEMKNRYYGGIINMWRDHCRRNDGWRSFSSYVSAGELAGIAGNGLELQSYSGLLLPWAWRFADSPRVTSLLRWLARKPLKHVAAHFVGVYRNESPKATSSAPPAGKLAA